MQEEIRTPESFLERTDLLAEITGLSLRSLAPEMGISVASLFGYRKGTIPISSKAWSKLEHCEGKAAQATRNRAATRLRPEPLPQSPLLQTHKSSSADPALLAVLERIAVALERLEGELDANNSPATSLQARGRKIK